MGSQSESLRIGDNGQDHLRFFIEAQKQRRMKSNKMNTSSELLSGTFDLFFLNFEFNSVIDKNAARTPIPHRVWIQDNQLLTPQSL